MNILRDISRSFLFSVLAILFGTVLSKMVITGTVWQSLINSTIDDSVKMYLLLFTAELAYFPSVLICWWLKQLISTEIDRLWNILIFLFMYFILKLTLSISLGILPGRLWLFAALTSFFIYFALLAGLVKIFEAKKIRKMRPS